MEDFTVFVSAVLRAVYSISNEKMSNQDVFNGLMRLHMVRIPWCADISTRQNMIISGQT